MIKVNAAAFVETYFWMGNNFAQKVLEYVLLYLLFFKSVNSADQCPALNSVIINAYVKLHSLFKRCISYLA